METEENRRGKDAAVLSGGHLCHVCGYQYPNPHPSAKLRRSHRKHCGKAAPAPAAVKEEEAPAGLPASDQEEGNAGERTPLGGKGGQVEGESDANGGAALLGSVREVGESAEDKAVAEHASSNSTGVRHVTREINENGQINCMDTENASPDDKVVNSELSKNGLVDCSSNSELVNEGNGAQLPIACNKGSQNEVAKHYPELAPTTVANSAELEDSFDEYQDASPFLHQSDLEDGALPSSKFPVEINNLNTAWSGSSAAANEISLGTNGLCDDQFSGELNLSDLSAGSKVGNDSDNGTLNLAGPGVGLKLEVPYESYKHVGNNHTGMVDNEPDKRFYHSESIGDPDASSLQKTHSVVLNADSQSTCSINMQGVMEDTMHALHNMYESSPTPEAVGISNAQLEIPTGSSSNSMPIGNELMVVHSENNPTCSSTELSTQNWPVKDTSDVQLPVESLCQKKLCSTVGFQGNLPPTSYVDDTLNPITKESCSDMDFTFEAMMQRDVGQANVTEENPSVQKTSGFTENEVCNKQIDPELPTEDQFPKCQKRAVLPMSQTSCAKNPFDLDDDRNDDLFELPTDSCYLKVPSAVSRQEVDSASLILDQPTISNQTRMAEVQHSRNSNDTSSSRENGHPVGPKDMPNSSSAELVMNTPLADVPLDHRLQEDIAHTDGISFASYQVASMEFRTVCTHDTSALGTGAEENTQTEEVAAKEMTVVRTTDDIEMKQVDDTTATDTYAINVEAKKVTDETAANMNEEHCNVEEKHTDSTQEVSVLQSMSDLEENKPNEDRNTKEMNAEVNADNLESKWQADDSSAEKMDARVCIDNFEKMCAQATRAKEVIALQCTEKDNENKQRNAIVGQEGDNKKEEIAVTGGRLNSGRIRVPLKDLLAEASAENKVNKPSAMERVLSIGRQVSKNVNSSAKSGSPKSGCDDHCWDSPSKLPRKDNDKSFKGRKQPWMPFICCHSVR